MNPLVIEFNEEKVHSLYPEASMVPAMLIWQLPKNKRHKLEEYCDSGDYIATIKIDGFFYTLNKTPNHTYLFSRNPGVNGLLTEKIDRVPHIQTAAEGLPADTLLVGEIYVPGKTSKAVTRIMGSLPDKAVSRQLDEGLLHYYLNDVIMYDGVDYSKTPYSERCEILINIYENHFKDYEFISVAEPFEEDIYNIAAELIAQGEEGVVLRKKTSLYEFGKRPAWSSIKIKQEQTFDVIITGFCEPTKEYKGKELDSWEYWITEVRTGTSDNMDVYEVEIPVTKHYYYGWKNAVEISAYDGTELKKIGTVSSGLTDELRAAFAAEPEKNLNRVIEIKCMSVDAKEHTIRHGYFLRFREDKNPEDCTFETIFS